jgi:hypothetical protein
LDHSWTQCILLVWLILYRTRGKVNFCKTTPSEIVSGEDGVLIQDDDRQNKKEDKGEQEKNTSGWGSYVALSEFIEPNELCHEFGGTYAFEFDGAEYWKAFTKVHL